MPKPAALPLLQSLLARLLCGLALFFSLNITAQVKTNDTATSCGQKKATQNLFSHNPQIKALHEQIEARLYQYNKTTSAQTSHAQNTNAIVYLPVVVHVIHNNGPENISNAQVQTAIQHLNEAFANTGYYDPADGVNTQIQFCLAKRDPNGNATNGINRIASPLTVMNGWEDYSVDVAVKNLSRWNPLCYINIWVVKDITGGVAGYAYLPSAHGSNVDGIVLESKYFGTSNSNDVVVIHEMGHYLGLYHTFDGGCKNDDCAKDGDRVCDTPPDQSTGSISCGGAVNSCTTDALSGFSTDQNDQHKAYMDYGNWSCMKVFTQGQSDRMNWFVQNVRRSLLNCPSCLDPCPSPVTAGFTSSANNISPGTLVNFTNTSVNAGGYRWYVNNALQSTTTNHSFTFNTAGTYVIKLVALPSSALCDSTSITDTIRVTCPVTAGFSPLSTSSNVNVTVNFTNSSTGASSYSWYVNGVLQGSGVNFSYAFTSAGNYVVKLKAMSGACADSISGTVVIADTCVRQTFHKTYGGANDDVAYDVRSTTDGGYIMAGKTNSFGAGNYDGYVVKLDDKGMVQWSSTYGGAAEDVINNILQTPDGGYVFVGTTKSYGSGVSNAWVVKLDNAGTTQWARRIGENSPNGETGGRICLTSDGGYAVIGSHDAAPFWSNVLVIKLDAGGNVSWSKVFDAGNTDGGGYISQDGNVLMATAFTRTSVSYHDAIAMKLDIASGNVLWMNRYEIDGRNNFAGEIFKVGDTYKFHVPTIQDFSVLNTGRNIILTLDNNGAVTRVQQLVPPDHGNGPVTLAPDGGIVAVYNEQNTVSEFNIMKLGSAGTIQWAKKYVRPGPQLNYTLRPSQDGGYITIGASNPAANNDIYLAKVDLQGSSAGCDTASIAVSVESPPTQVSSFSWSVNRGLNLSSPINITVQGAQASTQNNSLCAGTTCIEPPPPPDDTCKAVTFQKLLGTNGNAAAYDVKKTTEGGMMMAGINTPVGGTSDGLIVKTDAKGNILWSKTYATNGNDAFISLLPMRDGNYVAVGYGKFNASHVTDAMIIKISPNGNLIWAKAYGAGTAFGERAIGVSETEDGGVAIACNYNTSASVVQPLYMRLDVNGNLVWSKLLGVNNAGEGERVIVQGDVMYGSGVNSRTGGGTTLNDGYIVKFRVSDGTLLWTRRIESQNRSNRMDLMKFGNSELVFGMFNADSWQNINITPLIFKTDTSGNVTYSRSYEVQGLNNTNLVPTIGLAPDGGFIATVSEVQQTNVSPRLVRISPTGSVSWVRNYNPYFSVMQWNCLADTSGIIAVGEAKKTNAGLTQILFRRTNTNGYFGNVVPQNCPVTSSAALDNNIPVQSIPVTNYWNISSGNMQNLNGNLAVADIAMTVETPCVDTLPCSPPPPPDDTCDKKSFVKSYAINSKGVGMLKGVEGFDRSLFITGLIADSLPTGIKWNQMLMKTDSMGNVRWTKKLLHAADQTGVNLNLVYTRDHHVVTIGWFGVNNIGFCLTKYDTAGNLIWQRFLRSTGNAGIVSTTTNVVEDTNNDLYAIFNDPQTRWAVLSKFSANGTLLWSKRYSNNDIFFGMEGIRLTIVNDHIYSTGSTASQKYILKVNKSDGGIVWARAYSSGTNLALGEIAGYNNELIISGHLPVNGVNRNMVMKISTDGAVITARSYNMKDLSTGVHSIRPDGSVLMYLSYYDYSPPAKIYPSLLRVNNNLGIDWAKWYPFIPQQGTQSVIGLGSKSVAVIGSARRNSADATGINYLMRTSTTGGLTDCPNLPLPVVDSNIVVNVSPISNITVANFSFTNDNIVYTPTDQQVIVSSEKCSTRTNCDSFYISGDTGICEVPDTAEYRLQRNGTCAAPVTWQLNNTNAQIISFTDSSVFVKFLSAGTVQLSATIFTNCTQVTDSFTIVVATSRASLDLGADRQLCTISTLTLNAGAGFKSYKWQDGSSDSTYTLFQPGTYFVEAQTFCGDILRDTVIVSVAPDIAFDLGADLTKCNNDTLTITAPAGFVKYNWTDNYNISNRYTQTVKVWPGLDTVYSVMAETANGCLVYDTIRVKVNTSLSISIGADTGFCSYDSLIITAPGGFTSYTWNTGETSQQIIVKSKGMYWVQARAANNCVSKDSLIVLNVYPLPVVDLGNDTMVCSNGTLTFNAGNFANYLWQDGSVNQLFTASQVGKYWVRITSGNGCVNSDTVNILRMAGLPQNFLDTAAEFCPYEKASLSPRGNYVRYKWSTGSTSRSIDVNLPARYWLEVTNAEGCTNREFINVKYKNCRNQIEFPNAFTPNNDRLHDTYKPVIKGVVEKYRLTIYNRWGQRVFETTQPTLSWDGTIGGKPQDSGNFVWYCEYQFAGEEVKAAKGFLILIR